MGFVVVLFTSEIYFTRNITSAKKTRALEASGYLGGFSESAPHVYATQTNKYERQDTRARDSKTSQ